MISHNTRTFIRWRWNWVFMSLCGLHPCETHHIHVISKAFKHQRITTGVDRVFECFAVKWKKKNHIILSEVTHISASHFHCAGTDGPTLDRSQRYDFCPFCIFVTCIHSLVWLVMPTIASYTAAMTHEHVCAPMSNKMQTYSATFWCSWELNALKFGGEENYRKNKNVKENSERMLRRRRCRHAMMIIRMRHGRCWWTGNREEERRTQMRWLAIKLQKRHTRERRQLSLWTHRKTLRTIKL